MPFNNNIKTIVVVVVVVVCNVIHLLFEVSDEPTCEVRPFLEHCYIRLFTMKVEQIKE